ncbi:MAG: carboxypeptidase-like regulatory domain-containing protein [Bacteroidota bacterium]
MDVVLVSEGGGAGLMRGWERTQRGTLWGSGWRETARRAVFTVGVALVLVGSVRGQTLVAGVVVDAEQGVGLAAAHVSVADTTVGTITNAEGRFVLEVRGLPVTLEVRFLGYQSQRVTVSADDPWDRLEVRLVPSVVQLREVIVTTDDFAENLMRKVLARKERQRRQLQTTQAEGFMRLTLSDEGTIFLVAESVYDAYWDRTQGPREVVRSERETAGVHRELGLPVAGYLPTLSDDLVPIQGLDFIGPTHPDALNRYTFTLAGNRSLGDQTVYDLYVAPKTALDATFIGTLAVLDEAYAVLEVNLRPARHVDFPPPTRAWEVFYRQQYAPFLSADRDTAWLPLDVRLEGTAHLDPGGVGYRPFRLEQVARLSGHRVNLSLPAAPYTLAQRVTVDTASVLRDPLFLRGQDPVPMTPREAAAFERLQHGGLTLAQALLPRSPFNAFALFEGQRLTEEDPQFVWPLLYGLYRPELRFNRVDGYLAAIGQTFPLSPRLQVGWQAGQASGLRRVRYHATGRYRWGRGGSVQAGYHVDTEPQIRSGTYPQGLNTVASLLGAGDYYDYLWSRRATLDVRYAFPRLRLGVGYRYALPESVELEQRSGWLGPSPLRPNLPAEEGTMQTVTASVAWGGPPTPLRTDALNRAALTVEHALPGDFDFTTVHLDLDGAVPTFFRKRLRPNQLHTRLRAATFRGDLPPQRWAALDGTLGLFGGFGAFRSRRDRPYVGTQALGFFWAHDFTTVPFEAVRLQPFVDAQMGLRLFGGHGTTWLGGRSQTHHEIGLSLTNLAGTPLRLDLTRRLDQPGWFFGLGLSRLRR